MVVVGFVVVLLFAAGRLDVFCVGAVAEEEDEVRVFDFSPDGAAEIDVVPVRNGGSDRFDACADLGCIPLKQVNSDNLFLCPQEE